jgi:alkyldihydroxyacetonephosphate synthase
MASVKHMKWWGWGVEGIGFHHEDKPALRDFVLKAVALDLNDPPTPPMKLSDLPIPAPRISDELVAELTDAVGADNIASEDMERIVHTYGKSLRSGPAPRR